MHAKILMPKLHIPGVAQSEIIVIEFAGTLAISSLYRFTVEFVSKMSIHAQQVMSQKAQLIFAKKGGGTTPLNGEVVSFTQLDSYDKYHRYKIQFMPKVHRLQHIRNTEVFLNKSIPQVIKQILNKNGITQVELDLIMEHKPREFIFQYNEVDWDFITRWMEFEGLFYYFSQDKNEEKLVITDANSTLKNNQDIHEMYYQSYTMASQNNPTANLLYNFQLTTEAQPQKVTVKSYNPDQSSKLYSSKAIIDAMGHGEITYWAENIKSNHENQQLAKFISESYKWKKEILTGISSGSFINPGTIIHHKNFKMASLNIPMLIVESTYHGSQKRSFASLHSGEEHHPEDYFKCEYKAINKSIAYRQPIQDRIPRINGMLPGFVDHEGDDNTVQISKKGLYKFRIAISDDKPGKGSGWVRKMESYIGDQYAMSLPLRKGDEVVIGFQFGNPDLPILLGTVSNSTHRNVITSQNQHYMGLYTKEENLFFINEQDGDTKGIQLSTPHNETTLTLGTDNVFESKLDAGFFLNTQSNAYQRIEKNSISDISGHQAQSIGGNNLIDVWGTTSYSNKGAAYYAYYGARAQSVVGLDYIDRLGAIIETTTGFHVKLTQGWRYEEDGATSLKTAPAVMLEAEATISLTVGASSITITPESIIIQAPEIGILSEADITLAGAITNLATVDVNIFGNISGGPMVELGAGAGEEAEAAAAAVNVVKVEELVMATGMTATLKAAATAAWAAAKEEIPGLEAAAELGSTLVKQLDKANEKLISPVLAKAGKGVQLADKGHVLSPTIHTPEYIAKENE
ncbi:Uncharacterized protein conserved in bacteria [Legionella steigerwaltii]|uniref:Phage-related baseplate assembly protein n=1 Tax=Legionella steigerwaltii TaxID=460 RepID=A0A378L790_9GAMM|nr:type VI secretion system tip protein TssI/VgrG [Legionella steigerwaltii]KTD72042.1 Phage-related baseplate assembly protein [Legionella steigerwaltii]STY21708.1 Uncharacterized protein conserved in bacteria [Legionella steigerwaltii]